jgi:uncharacterized protein (TIGR03792 family)
MNYRYVTDERRPVEVLVFSMDPRVVDEFIAIDHEVWTLGEAFTPGLDRIPFLSKEVWLDDSKPGEVTLVFVWENQELWDTVGKRLFKQCLTKNFHIPLNSLPPTMKTLHLAFIASRDSSA